MSPEAHLPPRLFLCVRFHYRALHIDAVDFSEAEYGPREFRLEFLRAISEISLGRPYMSRVRHRIFSSLRKSVDTVGEFLSLFCCKSVVHSLND